MLQAEVDQYCIYGSDLDSMATASVSDCRSFDMALSVWLDECKSAEPLYKLGAGFWPRESSKQFL